MERTIISHDIANALARVRFEHNGVTVEQDYSLWDVIPGTRYVFFEMGLLMDEATQLLAIDRVQTMVQQGIEEGMIQNPPEAPIPEYQAPPEPTSPPEEDEEEEEPAE